MIPLESLWLLLLIAAVGAACFRAGWLASHAHLSAANTVSAITLSAAENASKVTATLDKYAAEAASLRQSVEGMAGAVGGKIGDVEGLIQALIVGLEQARLIRRPPADGGRASTLQVGEKGPE